VNASDTDANFQEEYYSLSLNSTIFFASFIETVALSSTKFINASSSQFISIYPQTCYMKIFYGVKNTEEDKTDS